ncbi:MAG TPA: hypothetical protein VMZ53_33405 [Kofleriaceae bacterium]|nr:hypothetical protein [Kofleriaceae bacterium]
MKKAAALLFVALFAGEAREAHAWEAETTQAGLAEQAALSSRLHKRLVVLGFEGGLFEPLTVPPADAPALIETLHLLSPSHGCVPDARGRQTALAWIAAGAAIADVPAKLGANHFFDPSTKQGWRKPSRGVLAGLSDVVREAVGRASVPAKGVPAIDWVTDKNNPLNLTGFLDQYAKAVSAATPGERSRAMAGALVAAGAMLHTLGDLGAPSRVRGDEAAHFEQLGGGPDDLGSRFERVAALAFGRLGIPAPSRVITREHLRDYFSAADGSGLADMTATGYFSPNTLPGSTRVGANTKPKLARPLPALPTKLNLMAATREDGTTLRNPAGVCLARYHVDHGVVTFSLDDECMLEEVTAILPEVAAFETGLLDFLLRGELTVTAAADLAISANGLGAGTLELFVEDASGVRKSVGKQDVAAGKLDVHVALPADGTRVVALFRGVDSAGEPLVAIGAAPLAAH